MNKYCDFFDQLRMKMNENGEKMAEKAIIKEFVTEETAGQAEV